MPCLFTAEKNPALVGAKAANLALLAEVPEIAIPDYLVIPTVDFERATVHLEEPIQRLATLAAEDEDLPALARRIRESLLTGSLPAGLRTSILSGYREFSRQQGEAQALVSVRSSATAEDGRTASFAGQYETVLNVRGEKGVMAAVRRVWASTFSEQAVRYGKQNGCRGVPNRMAVILQRMVPAVAAGTVYTVDPETGAPLICVNAVAGLGSAEVSGEATPTTWLVDPLSLTVISRRRGSGGGECPLDGDTLLALVRQVLRIRDHFRDRLRLPVLELEYACTGDGGLFFTQVRPETVWSGARARLTAVDPARAGDFPRLFQGGLTGSPGVATGTLRVVESIEEAEALAREGDILAAPNTTNIWERVFGRIGGIITDMGGTGSHTAVVMRETGKPALVGTGGALRALRPFNHTPVTLDATGRIVFAGSEAAREVHLLSTLTPAYGGADRQSLEDAWREASSLPGRTELDPAGEGWIRKPDYPVSLFMQGIYLQSHRWVAHRYGTPIRNEITGPYHRVRFRDIYQWREFLRKLSLEELESLQQGREAAVAGYLDASARFRLDGSSVRRWLRSYLRMNGYIGLGFDLHKVTEGLLEESLARLAIGEPYTSRLRKARAVEGDTESRRAARSLRLLAAWVQRDRNLWAALKLAVEQRSAAPLTGPVGEKVIDHARSFKVLPVSEIDLPLCAAVLAVAGEVLRRAASGAPLEGYDPDTPPGEEVEYFPCDSRLQRIRRLVLAAEKSRQDGHHLRVRGHWLVRGKLEELAAHLIARGTIESFSELFDHPPQWLISRVEEFQAEAP